MEKPSPAPPPTPLDIKDFAPPVTPKISYAPAPPPVEVAFKLPDIPAPHLDSAPRRLLQECAPPAPEAASAPPSPLRRRPRIRPPPNASSAPQPCSPVRRRSGWPTSTGWGTTDHVSRVDPIPLKDLSSIPGGIQWCVFNEPHWTLRGSPGGVPGGSPEVGEGGQGPGGDKSVAVGEGKGTLRWRARQSCGRRLRQSCDRVSGPAEAAGISAGTLPLKPEDLVYPVKPEHPRPAHPPWW